MKKNLITAVLMTIASPVTSNGYRIPNRTVVAIVMSTAVIRFFFICFLDTSLP